jgi:hypothetical protein
LTGLKDDALRRLSDDDLLELARSLSQIPLSGETSRSDLTKVLKRSLSVEEIGARTKQIRLRRRGTKGRRFASRRALLTSVVGVILITTLFIVWLGATPPQYYMTQNWVKTWEPKGYRSEYTTAVDATGKLYILGFIRGAQCTLALFDPSGDLTWTRDITISKGDGGTGYPIRISEDGGHIYVAGVYNVPGLGSKGLLAKLDSEGAQMWIRTCGDGGRAEYVASGSGIEYVVGCVDEPNETVFMAKYDSDGNQLCNSTWGAGVRGSAYAASIDREGNLVVTGAIGGNPFLAKFDSNLHEIWNATWSDGFYTIGQLVALSGESIYVLSAQYLRKYDSNGALVWGGKECGKPYRLDINGIEFYEALAITATPEGNVFVAGGDLTENGGGSSTEKVALMVDVFGSNGNKIASIMSPYYTYYLTFFPLVSIALQQDGTIYFSGRMLDSEQDVWNFFIMKFVIMDSFTVGVTMSICLASAVCIFSIVWWDDKRRPR